MFLSLSLSFLSKIDNKNTSLGKYFKKLENT